MSRQTAGADRRGFSPLLETRKRHIFDSVLWVFPGEASDDRTAADE